MILQPISFKTPQDITKFLFVLRSSSKRPSILKAEDGNLYLIEDIKQYMSQASEDELNASRITFKNSENNPITLAQIKANLNLIKDLSTISWETSQYISSWNDKLYSDSTLPSLKTVDEINNAKKSYNNTKVHVSIGHSKAVIPLLQIASNLSKILTGVEVPNSLRSADFINSMQKDFLKITLIQEAKLKHHLLNQIKGLANQQDVDAINQWIKEIEENNSKTKELLQIVLDSLKNHQRITNAARLKYSQLSESIIKENEAKIQELKKEEATQLELIDKLEKRERVLHRPTVNGIFFGVPILVIAALSVSVSLIVTPFIGLVAAVVAVGLSAGIAFLFTESLISLYRTLFQKIDLSFLVSSDIKKLEGMENQRSTLQKDVFFWNEYNKLDAQFRVTGGNHDALIGALESDLKEIEVFGKQLEAPTATQEPKATSISALSMFKNPEESVTAPVFDPPRLS
jgi:hypothetical protein